MPNTNEEYQRLLGALKRNPNYKIMLDTISKAEGTWGKDAYSTKYGGGKADYSKGKSRESVVAGGHKSNAHGKYQFMNDTWDELASSLGLTGFTPEEQDVAALKLLEKTGALKHIDNGEMDKAIFAAAPTWAALPKDANGNSAMKGQKAKPLSTVLGYMKSNEAARAEINNKYKDLNNKYSSSTDSRQIAANERKVKAYNEELKSIFTNKDLSEEQKNAQKHTLNSKYYREGYLSSINRSINEENKKYNAFIKKLDNFANKNGEDFINSKDGNINANAGIVTKKQFEELKKEAKQFNIDFGDPKFNVAGGDESNKKATRYLTPTFFKEKMKEVGNFYTPKKIEQGILKYGKTKEEYDAEVEQNQPEVKGIVNDVENNNVALVETAQEKADRKKVEAMSKAKEAEILAKKNKAFDGSEVLNEFKQLEEFADPQFKYTPGKQKIPFDSLIGLTAGLMGSATADSVELKKRDEEISEGMLQYAQDIAKIKNIGLDPSIEAGLKMKLADAYQTGFDNIVRASNGNRNLVLGNQGQLDKARMHGLVEMAAMDVDRTDKAMAAFGEVQKYINEFESRKNISNNERDYQEGKQKQAAGMQLAQQGMSSFIDAIQNAKENAPGSMNDMRRQYFQFAATGILPNAKEGEPGSASYKKELEVKREILTGKKRTYQDWINSKNKEDQDIIASILVDNPQFNINKNSNADFKELEDSFNQITGNDIKKREYLKSKKISQLTINDLDEKADMILGNTPKEPVEKEVQHIESLDAPIKTMPVTKMSPVQPTASKEIVKDKYSPVIVTADKLPEDTLTKQLADGLNGRETGVNTLRSIAIENQRRMENVMKSSEQINKQAQERDLIFEKKQIESEEKLNSILK